VMRFANRLIMQLCNAIYLALENVSHIRLLAFIRKQIKYLSMLSVQRMNMKPAISNYSTTSTFESLMHLTEA